MTDPRDPAVLDFQNPNPVPAQTDVPRSPPPLGDVVDYAKELTSEIKALIMLHPDAVRGHLLVDSEAREALHEFLGHLARDEELGAKLRELNPSRYSEAPEEHPQS